MTMTDMAELALDAESNDDQATRRYFPTLDAALRDFAIPLENLPHVREFLMERDFAEYYTTKSLTYIAAVPRNGGRPAFIHHGYIWHVDADGNAETIPLPTNRLHDGGSSRTSRPDRDRAVCTGCGLEMPSSGECAYC